MVQMLRVMLNKQMIQGKLTDDQYKELVTDMQDSVTNVVQRCQQEREEEEQVRWLMTNFNPSMDK